jgi:chemotaxis signal transduction protein
VTDDRDPIAETADSPESLTGLVVVCVGGERRGIDVNIVREVVPRPVVTPLPMAPALVAGLINLRGDIIAALDPLTLMSADAARIHDFAVVLEYDGIHAAILVERVDDVAWMTPVEEQQITRLNVAEILNHPQLQPLAEP